MHAELQQPPSLDTNLPILLTPVEVSAFLRIRLPMIYQMLAAGHIPSVRVGLRRLRIPRDQLLAWLKTRERGTMAGQ